MFFIIDECDELVPEWLNFVKGVVDSEDFPVCIPRETLQQNKILRVIKKTLVKSCLEMLAETVKEKGDYMKFSEQFGNCLNLCECDEGHELMVQENDSVNVAKDVEYKTNQVSEKSPDCMVYSSGSGSKRQRHNCNQQHEPGQGAQQRESVVREREEGEKVKGEKGVGDKRKKERRKRKLDGKVRRGGSEGEIVERKEEKEKEVEKNVTGWTLVTRSAKQMRRMVQIFVKVDEMKMFAMEVSTEDKVQKILNTVSGRDWTVYVTCEGRTLRKGDKLKSCGVRDGSTVQVTSRMRGGGKHKDKKGKVEKKHVAQLDDGMCAMACEQMRRIKESVSKVQSTDEDKRCLAEGMEVVRRAIAGVGKKAKGVELQRVAELEEELKKLEGRGGATEEH